MKLALAVLIYLIIAAILGAGILLLVAGKPWFLAIGFIAFVVAFGRIGCMPQKTALNRRRVLTEVLLSRNRKLRLHRR